jgi:hypothetical protein
MASIEINAHDLVVRLHGLDRVLALRSNVSVPLAHIVSVREHAEEANYDDAVRDSARGIGTFVRGRVAAGTLRLRGGRSFYDVHDPSKAIVIDLWSEPFEHLVVQVDGEPPETAVQRIRDALENRRAWIESSSRAQEHVDAGAIRIVHETYETPAWKSALAIATGIALAPVAAIAFVFLAPALAPLLVLGLMGRSSARAA